MKKLVLSLFVLGAATTAQSEHRNVVEICLDSPDRLQCITLVQTEDDIGFVGHGLDVPKELENSYVEVSYEKYLSISSDLERVYISDFVDDFADIGNQEMWKRNKKKKKNKKSGNPSSANGFWGYIGGLLDRPGSSGGSEEPGARASRNDDDTRDRSTCKKCHTKDRHDHRDGYK